jgi:hypothetical protein
LILVYVSFGNRDFDFLLAEDFMFVAAELCNLALLCCEGRIISVVDEANANDSKFKAFAEVLCGTSSKKRVLSSHLFQENGEFYLDDRGAIGSNANRGGGGGGKRMKRKNADDLAMEFVRKVKSDDALYAAFAVLLREYRAGGQDVMEKLKTLFNSTNRTAGLLDEFIMLVDIF